MSDERQGGGGVVGLLVGGGGGAGGDLRKLLSILNNIDDLSYQQIWEYVCALRDCIANLTKSFQILTVNKVRNIKTKEEEYIYDGQILKSIGLL